jgi:hypothetical protein
MEWAKGEGNGRTHSVAEVGSFNFRCFNILKARRMMDKGKKHLWAQNEFEVGEESIIEEINYKNSK